MKVISYKEACEKALNWHRDNSSIMLILFSNSKCDMCADFVDLAIPDIEKSGITTYEVLIDQESEIPFPPYIVPETYWFVEKGVPPIRRNGLPPNRESLRQILDGIV